MPCQEAVDHQEQITLELEADLFFECFFRQLLPDHFTDVFIEGVIAVDGIKAVFQDIGADIQLVSVQDHAFAGFSDNLDIPGIQLFTELFQIADQGSSAHIHFISQFICQKGLVCPHELAENIVLPSPRSIKDAVGITDFFKYFLISYRIENPETVSSLNSFD